MSQPFSLHALTKYLFTHPHIHILRMCVSLEFEFDRNASDLQLSLVFEEETHHGGGGSSVASNGIGAGNIVHRALSPWLLRRSGIYGSRWKCMS